ncbi:MAG: hypothetical protein ACLSHU_08505 [Oscillospiraceae bacterium]
MITFEADAVSQMDTMQVHLGQELGAAERNAMQAVKKQQQVMAQSIGRKLGYDIQVSENFTLLTNAVSATVKYTDLAAINRMDGVKQAFLMPNYAHSRDSCNNSGGGISPNLKYTAPSWGQLEPGTWGTRDRV